MKNLFIWRHVDRKMLVFVAAAFLLIGLSPVYRGYEYTGGNDGEKKSFNSSSHSTLIVPDDYSAIQEAIDNANDGDTIYVRAGIYYENVLVYKSVNITGENKYTTFVDAMGGGDIFRVTADNVLIMGFTIRNSSIGSAGVKIKSNQVTVQGNIIRDCGDGVHLSFSQYSTIAGNNIRDNDNFGIWLYRSLGNTIRDNVFQSNGIIISGDIEHWNTHVIENNTANGRPIRYYKNTKDVNVPGDTSQVILANCSRFIIQNLNLSCVDVGVQLGFSSDNTVSGNNIIDNHVYGIKLADSSNNQITGNNIDNNFYGIQLWDSMGNTMTENNITDNNNGGILLDSSLGNTIMGNNIRDNSDEGIALFFSSNNTINGNNVDNHYYGIRLHESSGNNIITGNNINNNFYGILLSHSNYTTIKKNNFIDNKNQAYFECSRFNFWFHNYWDNWKSSLPRPIKGTIHVQFIDKNIPWVNFDWSPATKPHTDFSQRSPGK